MTPALSRISLTIADRRPLPVLLASRVCARADAGAILTSDVVRQLVAGKGFLFADHGEAELLGFEHAVRLYEARWRE